MHPDERIPWGVEDLDVLLAREVAELALLSDVLAGGAEELVGVGLLKRGCRRNPAKAVGYGRS